ncbi:hypothetical protein EDD15DRAFT_2196719 [Pisolithus albus]|nr:hypothetical protein EDD15DRAFT_2196719 [Pisolithus albus]
MPRTKRTKGMAQCDPNGTGDTSVPSSSHEQTALTLRRTKRTTAGQGGTIMQLERVGDVLAQPQQMPRQRVVLPDDAPRNVLAPTPRRQRRVTQASQRRKTHTTENHTEDSAIEMNLDSGPLPEFQMAESGSRFGFQAQTPKQPSFVGTQSLNEYEQDRTRHQAPQNTTAPRVQGRAVASQTTTTTQLVSQWPRMPQDSVATKRNSRLTSRFRPQPLSMVPEVPSTSPTPDPFVSRAASTTVSGSSKGTAEKTSFKPSQTEHEPRSGEESRDSNDGPWSSLDDAGDAEDAEDEAPCGHAGSNDAPDSDCMSEDAEPHELDDELGLGGQTPSPQCPCSLVPLLLSGPSSNNLDHPDHKLHSNVPRLPRHLTVLTNMEKVSPHTSPVCRKIVEYGPIMDHNCNMAKRKVGIDYDVNARHQSRNRHPCPPSPTYLEDTVSGEKHRSKKLRSNVVSQVQGRLHGEGDCSGDSSSLVSERCGKYSRMTKADVVVRPTTLAFFSPLWCKLLGEAKGRMRLYVATEVPFLRREMAIDGVCMEILVEMVIKYEDDGLELEAGFYPEHKRSMATILFNDTQTFRSEIKKVAVHIVPFEYGLYPPENIDDNAERIDFVKKKAAQLLKSAQYLHGDLDSLGRTSNFAHSALKKTCLAVYYCTSSKSLHRFAEFQESVPMKALALVAAIIRSVLTTFKKHGVAKNETLCGDKVEDAYNNITRLIDQVWCDDYHGSKLDKMLREWAKAGMTGYSTREIAGSETEEWQVILD